MMIQKNSLHRVKITDMNNLGCGIARIDGMVVFVAGGVTGDTLDIKIIKCARGYLVARCECVIEPSPYRRDSVCAASRRCGGCTFAHIGYEYELELKRSFVASAFRRAGLEAQVAPVVSNGVTAGYRNKIAYPVSGAKLGYYATHSHDIIECPQGCSLEAPLLSAPAAAVREYISARPVESLRHVFMRAGVGTGEVMLCYVVRDGSAFEELAPLTARLARDFPGIVSFTGNINPDDTNVILGSEFVTLGGRDYIEDILCSHRFRLAPASFYQVNAPMAELLYEKAAAEAELRPGESLCDLYCGVGTIGICMALSSPGCSLTGVEIVPEAAENARHNARVNGLEDARFICGDAGAALVEGFDVIAVDPPRKGLAPGLVDSICAASPRRVVYVSCNPDTLARDCAAFAARGYSWGTLTPFDLFPRTGHVETVTVLTRA